MTEAHTRARNESRLSTIVDREIDQSPSADSFDVADAVLARGWLATLAHRLCPYCSVQSL